MNQEDYDLQLAANHPWLNSDSDDELTVCWLYGQVIAINGKFPGPQLEATTNYNLVINVHNCLDEPLLFTWYAYILPLTIPLTLGKGH
jgi:hypothetical protein